MQPKLSLITHHSSPVAMSVVTATIDPSYTTPSPVAGVVVPYFDCRFYPDVDSKCAKTLCAKQGSEPIIDIARDNQTIQCQCNPNRTLVALAADKQCKGYPAAPLTFGSTVVSWRVASTNLTTCGFHTSECAYQVCGPQDSPVGAGINGLEGTKLDGAGNGSDFFHCAADYDTAYAIYSGQYNLSGCNASEYMQCLEPGSLRADSARVRALLPLLVVLLLVAVVGV